MLCYNVELIAALLEGQPAEGEDVAGNRVLLISSMVRHW